RGRRACTLFSEPPLGAIPSRAIPVNSGTLKCGVIQNQQRHRIARAISPYTPHLLRWYVLERLARSRASRGNEMARPVKEPFVVPKRTLFETRTRSEEHTSELQSLTN